MKDHNHIYVHVVAGCVLEKDGKYLLVQEKKESAYGKWNLPAGRVDEGENFHEAAVREVFEETGFHVEIIKDLPVEHLDPSRPVLHAFQAVVTGGELTLPTDELLAAKWFTYEEILDLQANGGIRTDWVIHSIESCQ